MALTLTQLFQTYTTEDKLTSLLAAAQAKGLPTDDWTPGSLVRTILELEALENADYSQNTNSLAQVAFLSTAMADWLSLRGKDWYGLDRIPAVRAEMTVGMQNNSGSDITLVPGQLKARNTQGVVFTIVGEGTIGAGGGYSYMAWRADTAGSAGNEGPSVLLTPVPGLALDGMDDLYLPGVDEESDSAYRARCLLRWSSIGAGMNDDSYRYSALNYQGGGVCTHVKVVTPTTGQGVVNVYLSGPGGPMGSYAVEQIQAVLRAKAGSAITVNAYAAGQTNVAVVANVRLNGKVAWSTFSAAAQNAIRAHIATLEIGETLYLSQLVELIMACDGVVNAVVTQPTTDTVPTALNVCTYMTPTFTQV